MLLHHIAGVVRDFDPLKRLCVALGLNLRKPQTEGPFGCDELAVECGPAELVLFRPRSEAGPIGGWLRRHGPGLHHIMFDVDGLPALIERLQAGGVRFPGGLREHPWQRQAFIDPKQSCGGLIELGESWARQGPIRVRPGEPVLDHVAWAVRDMEEARGFFSLLGFEVRPAVPDTPVFSCDEASLAAEPCGISLKSPRGDGPFARHLAKRGQGLHHVCFRVQDLVAVGAELRKAGLRLLPEEPIPESHQRTWFVHPQDAEGLLVELGEPVRRQAGAHPAPGAAHPYAAAP